jgi:hypothetical protein
MHKADQMTCKRVTPNDIKDELIAEFNAAGVKSKDDDERLRQLLNMPNATREQMNQEVDRVIAGARPDWFLRIQRIIHTFRTIHEKKATL